MKCLLNLPKVDMSAAHGSVLLEIDPFVDGKIEQVAA